ncbi:unnamed protein product [Sphenostylis stenocarpa]|uniref:Uncharacterized protein n=1 Tax=Sphenostylis stenocarpa TaxID=92480 RepID=A0AA86TMF8_9FABA|nr:unnamed protein product [Sphenostylis stenocarpa]
MREKVESELTERSFVQVSEKVEIDVEPLKARTKVGEISIAWKPIKGVGRAPKRLKIINVEKSVPTINARQSIPKFDPDFDSNNQT